MSRQPGVYATFNTSEGTIVCRLFEQEAPITVKNFIDLAEGTREWTDPRTKKKSNCTAVRRHHFSSRHSAVHGAGWRPNGNRHGRPRLQVSG